MIIILNGVCGVGKTTIASYISKKLESCVYLSGDLIHSFIVNNKIESQQLKITNDNISRAGDARLRRPADARGQSPFLRSARR